MINYIQEKGVFKSTLIKMNIFHGFGTKLLGDGTKKQSIEHVLKSNRIKKASIIIPQQTHSTHVKVIDSSVFDQRYTQIPNTDALVTTQQNVVLSVVTADCIPIIYADQARSVIGISHGGWDGTLHNIVQNVINRMLELGARKKHIVAVIGPAIADCCYNIYGRRLEYFEKNFRTDSITESWNQKYLNLIKANTELLLSAGISQENTDHVLVCTSCDKARFWSYHRDHTLEGEMMHFVMIR